MKYDPNAPGIKGTLFGLPFTEEDSQIVIYPIPWDVTASYHEGSADGPEAIVQASAQLDLELFGMNAPWKRGIYMKVIDEELRVKSKYLRNQLHPYFQSLGDGAEGSGFESLIETVNEEAQDLLERVKKDTIELLNNNKKVGILGGDHSTPLGFLEALSTRYSDFGILQIDAHMDLRKCYEGFEQSHASIMYNALEIKSISKLVQVGIRDFCEEEKEYADSSSKVRTFFNDDLKSELFAGISWAELCQKIISVLPSKVYVSFDIDGLDPSLCPGTGTPVPGGLQFDQAIYLLDQIPESGREVIGFDLCEVAPQDADREWNANVGARILYRLLSIL